RRRVRDIELGDCGYAASTADLLRERPKHVDAARSQSDLRTLARKNLGEVVAEAAGRAGDHRHLAADGKSLSCRHAAVYRGIRFASRVMTQRPASRRRIVSV